jgi:hypothetical protein
MPDVLNNGNMVKLTFNWGRSVAPKSEADAELDHAYRRRVVRTGPSL